MGIWQANDLFFAAVFALLAAGVHRFIAWMREQIKQDDTISSREAKFCHYGLLVLRGLEFLAAAYGVGIIVLPLLDAMLSALLGTAFDLFDRYGGLVIIAAVVFIWLKNRKPKQRIIIGGGNDVDIEMARQAALDMQSYALGLMLRVLVAISSFTPVIRPRSTHDIEVHSTDGASFYMKDDIVVYQAEAEVEGEITPEVEDIIQREAQRYAQKYIVDYPMLISPEAGGRAPVEVLGVKNCGSRVLIDYIFTSAKSFDLIDARRRARIERQKRQEKPRPYADEDYS